MPETHLDYDKIIWEVFSIGVVSSVIILYYGTEKIMSDLHQILTLTLGFAILAYSFILFKGYNFKKKILGKIIGGGSFKNEDYKISKEMDVRLSKKAYPRVKWMAEFILILIGIIYFYSFTKIEVIWILIPIFITLLFTLMSILANLKSLGKE